MLFRSVVVSVDRHLVPSVVEIEHLPEAERVQVVLIGADGLPFKAPPRIREGGKFPKRQGVGIDSGNSGETEDEIVKRSRA